MQEVYEPSRWVDMSSRDLPQPGMTGVQRGRQWLRSGIMWVALAGIGLFAQAHNGSPVLGSGDGNHPAKGHGFAPVTLWMADLLPGTLRQGYLQAQDLVLWKVAGVNDPPVALDDAATTNEDTPLMVPVANNDADPNNDPVTFTVISGPFHGTAVFSNDTLQYTPALDYNGVDTLQYTICDNGAPSLCDTATLVITILAINDAPVAAPDSSTLPNDTASVSIPILTNDVDPESGILTVTISCGPTNGTATLNINTLQIVYVPDPSFLGTDSICYIVCDDGAPQLCDTTVVYLTLTNGNNAPIAIDDTDSTLHDTPVTVPVVPNDTDPNGHTISATAIICGPSNGTATLNGGTSITYTPNYGFLGLDSICYVLCDNPPAGGPFCDTAVVYITVLSSNVAPVAVTDTTTIDFGATATLNLLANDSDANTIDSLFLTLLSQPGNGTVLVNNGVASYVPNTDFFGVDSFCYELCDNGVPAYCDTTCVYISIRQPVDIEIPNGFSPNGDGANDFLVVEAVTLYPNNTFQVFTRWGTMVFEAQPYANDWDGTWNGNPVPEGTYFFRLDPGDGTAQITGFTVLYR